MDGRNSSPLRDLMILVVGFALVWWLPVGEPRFDRSVLEALHLARWYAREHVLLCLVPAFFIAGAVGTFLTRGSVMRYLGARAPRGVAYLVASASGTILAVCSCTVLPLFAGIHRMGAGLGPACSFLYSGPAINVLAIVLTAQVLGWKLGLARTAGAIGFALVLGLSMEWLFPEEVDASSRPAELPTGDEAERPLGRAASQLALLMAILVFANWADPGSASGFFAAVYRVKWPIVGVAGLLLALLLGTRFSVSPGWLAATVMGSAVAATGRGPTFGFLVAVAGLALALSRSGDEAREWLRQTWEFALEILPLLFGGVLMAGFLLGRPGGEGMIPSAWVTGSVGGEGLLANAVAAFAGSLMYFATLTEVPILQGLLANGMGQGPALALLLAGPAVSLPNLLVIRSVLGTRRTLWFLVMVVVLATAAGWIYGNVVLGNGR